MYFHNFIIILEKGGALHWNKLESPTAKDALCQVWLNWPSGSGEEFFFYFVNVFTQFRNYLPLEKGRVFFYSKLNPLQPRMIFGKFG